MKKKHNAKEHEAPDSKTTYKDTTTKIVGFWCKNKQIGQWNRTESLKLPIKGQGERSRQE